MKQLGICAFGAFVITTNVAYAQDARSVPEAASQTPVINAGLTATSSLFGDDGRLLLGQDKTAPLCPPLCAPRRITSPEQATVGEREVMAVTMAAAVAAPKLHVDGGRSTFARIEKLPGAVTTGAVPTAVTQNEFRPALDPVLAEPTTEETE